jgi:hypothetical protein
MRSARHAVGVDGVSGLPLATLSMTVRVSWHFLQTLDSRAESAGAHRRLSGGFSQRISAKRFGKDNDVWEFHGRRVAGDEHDWYCLLSADLPNGPKAAARCEFLVGSYKVWTRVLSHPNSVFLGDGSIEGSEAEVPQLLLDHSADPWLILDDQSVHQLLVSRCRPCVKPERR